MKRFHVNPRLQDIIRDDDFYERVPCPDFCNEGIIITCCDDLCANTDHCIHGDGEEVCPTCEGNGFMTERTWQRWINS